MTASHTHGQRENMLSYDQFTAMLQDKAARERMGFTFTDEKVARLLANEARARSYHRRWVSAAEALAIPGDSPPSGEGLASPEGTRKLWVFGGIGVAAAVVILAAVANLASGGNGGGNRDDETTSATTACRSAVLSMLKAPSTASVSAVRTEVRKQDGAIRLTGFVDAENSFGARLRSTWVCVYLNGRAEATILD